MLDLVTAAASRSAKGPDGNEDRVEVVRAASEPAGAAVVVCDGVGSMPDSAAVAERVATRVARHLTAHGVGTAIWQLEGVLAEEPPPEEDGATTLIVVGADADGDVTHLLVGNGSLIEIDAVEPQPGVTVLRWTDIVLPQISWEGGRAALRASLPARAGGVQAAIGCRRTRDGRPRMYLACSDGITSEEDRRRASAQGLGWREVPRPLAGLLDALKAAWPELLARDGADATELLERTLEQALATLGDDEPGLDDDASVGVLLLRPQPDGSGER